MTVIEELIEIFRRFPGVGPRQAERFVYYLLRQNKNYLDKISRLIPSLSNSVKICQSCQKFYLSNTSDSRVCKICTDKNRQKNILMVVAHDVDLDSIEKSETYDGLYFVLGGTIPILEKNFNQKIRLNALQALVRERAEKDNLKEIILALNANPEGENTAMIIHRELKAITDKYNIKIKMLGRGLSTGTEIEYSDTETIKNALENRF